MPLPRLVPALDVRPLRDAEDARGLVELLYETHGLSFHRPWMYQPELILERARRGLLQSFLAFERGRIVGHHALLSPDLDEPGTPLCNPRLREAGLQLYRNRTDRGAVAQRLAGAVREACLAEGVTGLLLRVAAHRTHAIAAARTAGAVPVGLLLGAVPRWTAYAHETSPGGQALSTLLLHLPLRPQSGLRLVAETLSVPDAFIGSSQLHCRWDGGRQTATIQVPKVGPDLPLRLEQSCRWLVGGHIGHISVFLAADQPGIDAMGPALARIGLFAAGRVPGWFADGQDALVLQTLAWQQLDPERIQFEDPASQRVRDEVVRAWRALEPDQDLLPAGNARGVIIRFDALRSRSSDGTG